MRRTGETRGIRSYNSCLWVVGRHPETRLYCGRPSSHDCGSSRRNLILIRAAWRGECCVASKPTRISRIPAPISSDRSNFHDGVDDDGQENRLLQQPQWRTRFRLAASRWNVMRDFVRLDPGCLRGVEVAGER